MFSTALTGKPASTAADPTSASLLSFQDVRKTFGGVVAVDDLTMEVPAAGITGLIGPNGAGKTTIFNLATGFLRPDRGRILFRGADITAARPQDIFRLGIVRTFQEMRLFDALTVYENLRVCIEHDWRRRRARAHSYDDQIHDAMERVGLAHLARVPAEQLSYAEKKMLSLGRGIVTDAPLLLLDEPASGLDDDARDVLIATIKQVADDGRKVIVIEHNLDVVRELVTDVMFLNLGHLMAHGPLDELIQRADLTDLYFGEER